MLRYHGTIIEYLSKIGDIIILNVLWLVCCVPIVTIGPATIAAHYVALKFVRDEGTSVIRMFFKSFRRNLRQGIVLGLISLMVGSVLLADLWLILTCKITFAPMGRLVILSLLWLFTFFYMIVMLYVWGIMARFDNTLKNMVLNACVLAITNVRSTLAMLCWDVSLAAAAVVCAAYLPQFAVLFLAFGVPSLFILNATKLRPLLDQCVEGKL